MATPPFSIAETSPADSDIISIFPTQEHTFRDVVESWLTLLSDPATGLLRSTALTFPFTMTNAAAGSFFILESTDTGAAIGPELELYRNSANPAAADVLGGLGFYGEDSAGNKQEYGRISAVLADPTTTAEDGTIRFRVTVAGVATDRMDITTAGVTVTGTIIASGAITGTDFQSATTTVQLGTTGAGTVKLRPNGVASATGELTVADTGAATVNGALTVTSTILASSTVTGAGVVSSTNIFANSAAATMSLRPSGVGSATGELTITAAGNVTAAGDITASSDRRLKKSISPLGLEWAKDMVRNVQPVTYLHKKNDQRGIGFIAQDVQGYAPELVRDNPNGMLSLAYPNMVAILWRVVQDLQAHLEGK